MTVNRKLTGSNDQSINEELQNTEMELTIDENVYDKLFRNLKESVLAEMKDKTFPPTSKGKKELIMQTKGNHAPSGNIQPQNNCPEIIVTGSNLLADQENYMNDIINLDNSASHRRKFNTFDIIEYIKTHIPHIAVSCTELKVKSGQYRSFKVGVPANISSQILNSNFWPEHLVVKRFLEPKGNFRVMGNNTQRN
ncbi:hypothetical protein WA026_020342 [Henosepilachna vigintioctopunctata]|uniref:Transposase n=1 Tax=Henosepilachna vigintioctopunctata TaxID=420089 RepID=A0AAW1TN98_9CUCU